MSVVLVIGGYGGFGARLSRRLANAGHDVIVAGRDLRKAQLFCESLPGARAARIDRAAVAEAIDQLRPDVVADASGPFQNADYSVARACVEARIHYVDLADARDFVAGIGALDDAARAAGVCVISGASSVPALSGAVARKLSEGMQEVRLVEIAISSTSRATSGDAVVKAILSYVGSPVRLWRGGRWVSVLGWGEPRRVNFAVPGRKPLNGRMVQVADVPDLETLPPALPGNPSVVFRAGGELTIGNQSLRVLGLLVQGGFMRSLSPLAPFLIWAARKTSGWGVDASAMSMRVVGFEAQKTHGGALAAVEKTWTLVAEEGHGPEIPTMALPLCVEAILDGRVASGARHAGGVLTLEDFEPGFAALSISHETKSSVLPPPLYERVMGRGCLALPGSVREMHRVAGDCGAQGEAVVEGPATFAARAVRKMMRFPEPGQHPVHVSFAEMEGKEVWTRDFGGKAFHSELSEKKGRLIERFGPLRVAFDLPVAGIGSSKGNGLEMKLRGWSVFGVPLPLALAPRSRAKEWDERGVFQFEVPIELPLIGLVIRYRGWLKPVKA